MNSPWPNSINIWPRPVIPGPPTPFHHDLVQLPNGRVLLLVNSQQDYVNLPGFPGTTTVLGDSVVDLDSTLKPVWVWSSFRYHLDINRHPMQFPDWTHTNAILYSPDDGNIVLSIRHQDWIIKIDYANGQGTGNICGDSDTRETSRC